MKITRKGFVPVRCWLDSEKQPHHYFLVGEIGIDLETVRNKAKETDAKFPHGNDNPVQMFCKVCMEVDTMNYTPVNKVP